MVYMDLGQVWLPAYRPTRPAWEESGKERGNRDAGAGLFDDGGRGWRDWVLPWDLADGRSPVPPGGTDIGNGRRKRMGLVVCGPWALLIKYRH